MPVSDTAHIEQAAVESDADAHARREEQIKALVAQCKDRGFLTHAEIIDHLPEDTAEPDTIECVISSLNEMGIAVVEHAPDAEALLLSDTAAASPADEVETAIEAISTVEAEADRTTDPLQMYMRQMGATKLLTREREIEIAKRIEEAQQ